MTIAAFDHPYLSGLVGDDETAAFMGVEADVAAMLAFEAALAQASAAHGFVPDGAARDIAKACAGLKPDIDRLRSATARDGVVVPELVRQLKQAVGGEAARFVHAGATSQDAIDTSLMIRLRQVAMLFAARIVALAARLADLEREFGTAPLMGRTRMQAALPITAADRIGAWREPLLRHRERLETLLDRGFVIQLGGPVGTLDTFGDRAAAIRREMADRLSLSDGPAYHGQRDRIVDIAGLFATITGSLGKFGQDVALMAQGGDEIALAGGGASSAMAHKQNPVAAEVLVSLARFNAVQAGGMQQAMIHEQERSGAAWTLEWLLLPQMAMATGAALRLAFELAADIRRVGKGVEDA